MLLPRQPVAYEDRLDRRDPATIDLVVIHCTELPDLATAREYAGRIQYPGTRTGACGHWYVDRDGSMVEYVAAARVAHHCVGYNARSVGIELVNLGRWPDWLHASHQVPTEPYPDAQVEALLQLLQSACRHLPALRWIAGHEDLDTRSVAATDDERVAVRRKRDPGPLFPWARVLAAVPGLARLQPAPDPIPERSTS